MLAPLIAQASQEGNSEVTDNLGDQEAAREEAERLEDELNDGSDDNSGVKAAHLRESHSRAAPSAGKGKGKDKTESIPVTGKRQRKGPQPVRDRKSDRWKEVDAIQVILPSSCPASVRSTECMREAVEIETALRVAQANDALDLLRTELITSYAVRNLAKKSEGNTHAMRTRMKTQIYEKDDDTRMAASEYRRAYQALIALGYSDKEQRLKPLHGGDIKPFVISITDQELGYSRSQPSWIWQELKFLDTDDVAKNFDSYTRAGKRVTVTF